MFLRTNGTPAWRPRALTPGGPRGILPQMLLMGFGPKRLGAGRYRLRISGVKTPFTLRRWRTRPCLPFRTTLWRTLFATLNCDSLS